MSFTLVLAHGFLRRGLLGPSAIRGRAGTGLREIPPISHLFHYGVKRFLQSFTFINHRHRERPNEPNSLPPQPRKVSPQLPPEPSPVRSPLKVTTVIGECLTVRRWS